MSTRRIVGAVQVESGQLLILDPVRLTKAQYDAVAGTPRADGGAEVWFGEAVTIRNFLDPAERTNDGVVIDTASGGRCLISVEYGSHGRPTYVRIELE